MEATVEAFDLARSLRPDDWSRFVLLDEVAKFYGASREAVEDFAVANPSSDWRVFTYGF